MNAHLHRSGPDFNPVQSLAEFIADTRDLIGPAPTFPPSDEDDGFDAPAPEPAPGWWEVTDEQGQDLPLDVSSEAETAEFSEVVPYQPSQLWDDALGAAPWFEPSPSVPKIQAKPFVWRDPKSFPRRQWLYGSHLIRKFISCTVAPGGVGKSSLILVEAVAMASGRDLLGVPVRGGPHRIWIINLEDPLEELERRVVAICMHFGVDPSEIAGRLLLNSGRDTRVVVATTTRSGTEIAVPVVDQLRAEIRDKMIDVVMIDPFVKAHRVPENDNGAIDTVCTIFADIADETDCAFDLVHHVRKTNGAEVTVEDGRGAVALLAAARSARALNRMSKDEAEKAGVEDPRFYFRAETGKANLAPPDKAEWLKLISVSLGNDDGGPIDNADHVAVAERWTWPDAFTDVSAADLLAAQRAVSKGRWRENVQAKDWVGVAIADALGLDVANPIQRTKVATLLKTWMANKMFVVVTGKDASRNERSFVEVGQWATD